MPGERILVVDDEPGIRAALGQLLEYEGYEVHTLANAADGIAEYQKWRPQLVFLDVKMEGMDGLETLLELRRRYSTRPGEADIKLTDKLKLLLYGSDGEKVRIQYTARDGRQATRAGVDRAYEALDEHARLARARAGEYQERARSSFQLQNPSIFPITVVLELRGFADAVRRSPSVGG
mgnify:CR=1 FL=1